MSADDARANAWLDKWQVGEIDGANLLGPLLTLLDEVRADERKAHSKLCAACSIEHIKRIEAARDV